MAIKTWTATNTGTWRSSKWRSQKEMYQGDYTGSGNNHGFAWFDTSSINSALTDQIIDKVEIYLHRVNSTHGHSWALPINLYTHNYASGGTPSTSGYSNKQTDIASFNRGEGKWFTVSNAVGTALKNKTARGIVLYHSANQDHYMIFDAYNSSYPPKIRITYHVANTAPTTPGSFTSPSSGTIYESSVSVAWGKATDADGDTLTYQLQASINGGTYSQIYRGTALKYTHSITGVTRGQSIKYRVRAYDGTAYSSSYVYSNTCYRNRTPSVPSAFTSPSATRYEGSVSVAWGSSSDADGHSVSYRLEVSINGGTYSQIYSGTTRSYKHTITSITRGRSIRYRARAYDGMAYGNYTYSSTCYRNNAPSTPAAFTSPSGTIKRESKTISWGHSTDDATSQANLQYEVGISTNGGTSYSIIRSFATGNSFSYNFANVSTDKNFTSTNCYLRVRARDGSNITSGYRTSSKFTIDFKEPPTRPSSFSTGIGTSVEKSTITIGWSASTDPNGDAITYLVQFWNRSSWITIASENTTTSLSYTLPAVSAQYSDYKFRVRAKDATGLTSSYRESGTFAITQNSAPSLVANTYSQRTMATVKVSGSITNLGGHSLTQYGIKWGTGTGSLTNTVNLGTKLTIGSFTGEITGLDGDTVYYAKTYATNAKGTTLSSELITIPKYNPPLYIDTLGVGVGKKRAQGALDVEGDIYSKGKLISGDSMDIIDIRNTNPESNPNFTTVPIDMEDRRILPHFAYVEGAGSSWRSVLSAKGWTGNYAVWQLIGNAGTSADDDLYFRSGVGTSWRTPRKIWHSGNLNPSSYSLTSHNHSYLPLSGGNLTGNVTQNSSATMQVGAFTRLTSWANQIRGKAYVWHIHLDGTNAMLGFTNSAGTESTYTLNHSHPYASSSHNHSGANITLGTVPYARLPVGTGSSQVSRGNHTHSYLAKSLIRTGTFTATSSGGKDVSFASAMSSTPYVFATYRKTGASVSGDWGSPKIYNVTKSGFTCMIGGSNDTTARALNYFAISY